MEIVWYRMLAPLLGGSTFSFGLILACALLGIGFGGVTYAFFDLKRSASLRFFALTCAAEAFFVALPYALGDRIAMLTMLLRPLGTLGFYGHAVAWSAICLIVIFPAAFLSGLQFPLLIALLGKGNRSVGAQTGTAYAWNTVGALDRIARRRIRLFAALLRAGSLETRRCYAFSARAGGGVSQHRRSTFRDPGRDSVRSLSLSYCAVNGNRPNCVLAT